MSGHNTQRGVSPVAGTAKPFVSKKAMTIGLGVSVCAIAGFVWWKSSNPPEPPQKEKLPEQLGAVVAYSAPQMVIPTPAAASPAIPRFEPPPLQHFEPPPPSPPLMMPHKDPVARVASTAAVAAPPAPQPYMLSFAPAPRPAVADAARGSSQTDIPTSVVYASSKLDGVKAGLLGDQTFLLMPGLIKCYLDTAVDSTFPGPVECHIPSDIRPNGVTLLDRGSVIHATYSNAVQTGQARLAIAADWVEDKATGCFVKFDNAPVADFIGQAGVAGNVDPHNWERFSAAMLLTGGQAAESLAQAGLSKGGNTYLNFNSGGGVESIANAILRKQIDIPPTITLHQGAPIAVFLMKPLDFSPCYNLEIKDR